MTSVELLHTDGTHLLTVHYPDEKSFALEQIGAPDTLSLSFQRRNSIDIPIGTSCTVDGKEYFLLSPPKRTMRHSALYDYELNLSAYGGMLALWRFRNPVDGRTDFPLTAKPSEHLAMLLNNLNARSEGWSVGYCITASEKLVLYKTHTCLEALEEIAKAFDTEWVIEGKRISLKKLEFNRLSPLPLAYGEDKGLRPDIETIRIADKVPASIAFVTGGNRNIDTKRFPGGKLTMPKSKILAFDGTHFEDEAGYNKTNARSYTTDEQGYSVRKLPKSFDPNNPKPTSFETEIHLDYPNVYPSREGKVTALSVRTLKDGSSEYGFIDTTIPEALDYKAAIRPGQRLTIVFQDGMLAGRELDADYLHADRKFTLISREEDGITIPAPPYVPTTGDRYGVFGISLPDAYFADDSTHTGAQYELMKHAIRHLASLNGNAFTLSAKIDPIWYNRHKADLDGKIRPGAFVRIEDTRLFKERQLVRIVSVKRFLSGETEIELSNETTEKTRFDLLADGVDELLRKELKATTIRSFLASRLPKVIGDQLGTDSLFLRKMTQVSYRVRSNGSIRNGKGSVTLTAIAYKLGEEVTASERPRLHWRITDNNGTLIAQADGTDNITLTATQYAQAKGGNLRTHLYAEPNNR